MPPKKKRKKNFLHGKDRRELRAVRQELPPGNRRARQAGHRRRARHAGRNHVPGHRRCLQGAEGLRLLPADRRLHREDVRCRPHSGRLPQARGQAFRQGHPYRPHDRPSHSPRLRRRLQAGSPHCGYHACVRRPEPARLHLRGRRLCRASVRRHPVRRPGCLRAHCPQRRDRRVYREPHLRRAGNKRPRAHHRWHQRLHLYGRSRRSGSF